MKVIQKTLTAKISEKTGLNTYRSKRALQTALDCIKQALAIGKQVDLGKLGKLKVVARKPARRINKNLRHVGPNVEDVYKKHPKTIRLLGGQDLSSTPLPTVVTKNVVREEPIPAVSTRRVAVAFPSWRRRIG
jgi:nucleoid DNA-binding protein